jgi:hypothetical protein
LRANGSRECAPDDRLREAIRGCETKLDCFVGVPMLDHDNRVWDEFTRQAETFSASAAITGAALTQRFIDALGEAARGSVLDVACEGNATELPFANAGTFFFIDPKDDMLVIIMVQTPSQRGRIQLALKTLIYQALKN